MNTAEKSPQDPQRSAFVSTPGKRTWLKDAVLAFSLANLCFMVAWFSPLYDADSGFFNKQPVTAPTLLGILANWLWFGLLALALLRLHRRLENPKLRLCLHLVFFLLLLLPVDFCRTKVFEIADYRVWTFFRQPAVALPSVLVVGLMLWKHERVARLLATCVCLLSPLMLFSIGRVVLLLLGLERIHQSWDPPALAAKSPVHPGQPRVLWVLFDETDYRLGFEQRPPAVVLTNFDRFRAETLWATNAYPPGCPTVVSIPALLSGRPVMSMEIAGSSDLRLTPFGTTNQVLWSELPSVFAEARALGVNTAAVGWYLPYDRVLGKGLNYCSWYPTPSFESVRSFRFAESLRRQCLSLSGTFFFRYLFAEICQDGLRDSLSVATNQAYGLIFLHLPPPHKPGIYLPKQGRFSLVGMPKVEGYFNNLYLADRMFGALRDALERAGEWERTWVILSSDHSWRESLLADGRKDMRVPWGIKAPGDKGGQVYGQELHTVVCHDLVLAILQGQVTNRADLLQFLIARDLGPRTVRENSLRE